MKQSIVTKVDYVELRLDADDLELLKDGHSIVMAGGDFRIVKDGGPEAPEDEVEELTYRGFALKKLSKEGEESRYWIKKSLTTTPFGVNPQLRSGSYYDMLAGIDVAWKEWVDDLKKALDKGEKVDYRGFIIQLNRMSHPEECVIVGICSEVPDGVYPRVRLGAFGNIVASVDEAWEEHDKS